MAREEPKTIVSLSIDPDLLEAIKSDIDASKRVGIEMDFSKWMRDAVRRKLRRFKSKEKKRK